MDIIIKDTLLDYKYYQEQYTNIDFINTLFFDIETTGFTAKNSHIYMIGVLYVCKETHTFKTIQWFLEDCNNENLIISEFKNFLYNYKTIIHFNGKGFDIPYLEAKAETYGIALNFITFEHIDLYKVSSKLKKILKTENLKQKTLEQFFSLNRDDQFTGKELINVYKEYLLKKDNNLKNFLLLHNYEDLKGMLTVINILAYDNIFRKQYSYTNLNYNNDTNEIIIEMELLTPLLKRVSYQSNEIYFTAYDNKIKLMLKLYNGTLKFFYENYKDYYYLPLEDQAIHKSLAFCVDKEYREKAKACNCYIKKEGYFLPQYTSKITPSFKQNHNDKIMYFEYTDEFTNSEILITQYVSHILEYLLNSG